MTPFFDAHARKTVFYLLFKNASSNLPTNIVAFISWRCDPTRVMASSFTRFLDHTQRRSTVGRTPLVE
jgi:hypothetical protein